jgi:hypothetical protein
MRLAGLSCAGGIAPSQLDDCGGGFTHALRSETEASPIWSSRPPRAFHFTGGERWLRAPLPFLYNELRPTFRAHPAREIGIAWFGAGATSSHVG